ncbi:MAG: bifunctional folylpolyglutamate synthase/dihydrofolate synthase, partial [Bacteroidetes bacterium]
LLAALGHPEQQFRSIHVGGTNGKGSVTHLLGAVMQAHGLKTGLYTSPHYKDFRERIKINGQYVPQNFVVDFVDALRPQIAALRPSFFEITVAMAFSWFAHQQVDMAIVEVGLGGRLDSTNVLQPDLAVITNISYDHQQFLGDTLPAIAGEKAGIIKANTPVVIGETTKETAPVFRTKAQAVGAPISFADQHFRASLLEEDLQHTTYAIYRNQQLYAPALKVNLHGPYQTFNLQTALQALEVWQQAQTDHLIPFSTVATAWNNLRERTRYYGRWQVLSESPTILVDSAHNIGGLKLVMERLEAQVQAQLHIVLGVVNDKELHKILPLFPTAARYYFAKADIPRGLPARELQAQAATFGLKGRTYTSVTHALAAAKRAAKTEDTIFVGGSIFTVAEVL